MALVSVRWGGGGAVYRTGLENRSSGNGTGGSNPSLPADNTVRIESIKSHLNPYSIYGKRRTTINHAFASAVAPNATYDRKIVGDALRTLGQDPETDLTCVYCGKAAETWDHIFGLVKNNGFSGFGHVVENLAPCCRSCNQKKGNKNWKVFFAAPEIAMLPGSKKREKYLARYVTRYESSVQENVKSVCPVEMKNLDEIKEKVFKLLEKADVLAAEIRRKMKG